MYVLRTWTIKSRDQPGYPLLRDTVPPSPSTPHPPSFSLLSLTRALILISPGRQGTQGRGGGGVPVQRAVLLLADPISGRVRRAQPWALATEQRGSRDA